MEWKPYSHYAFHIGFNTPAWTHTIYITPFSWHYKLWLYPERNVLLQIGPVKFSSAKAPPCPVCEAMKKARRETG